MATHSQQSGTIHEKRGGLFEVVHELRGVFRGRIGGVYRSSHMTYPGVPFGLADGEWRMAHA